MKTEGDFNQLLYRNWRVVVLVAILGLAVSVLAFAP